MQVFIIILLLSLVVAGDVYAKVMPQQVAIVINTDDAESRLIAEYYRVKRNIPEKNIIEISMPSNRNSIGEEEFSFLFSQVKKQTPDTVQYYALAWRKPYKVKCMSITSAFAYGFNEAFCAKGCKPTRRSDYYDSDSVMPNRDFKIRPSMMLAGSSLQQVYEMIDRGVSSDGMMLSTKRPDAAAYLMRTTDKARNVRARRYDVIEKLLSKNINIEQVSSNVLQDKKDVMFYFTGLSKVEKIDTNGFLPGAIADHLTSSGGQLFGRRQMSIFRWLDAGATASYGTVVEPCAFTQKFPNPGIVIERYTSGESLIEAYWKSVAWPGQGVFVGELMAAPYTGEFQN